MTERRITHVVGKTGRADDSSYFRKQGVGKFRMLLRKCGGNIISERHSHARHLQTVGKAVMYKDAAGQRKHLGLVLHTAEGCRKYQTVVVTFEFATVVMSLNVSFLLSEALVGNKLLPVHKREMIL